MPVLDILIGVALLGILYWLLPKYSKIGGAIDRKIESSKEKTKEDQ